MDSVSAFLADATALANSVPMGLPQPQIELIWQMGVASFPTNGNELVIPQFMAVKLNQENIEDLMSRLSVHLDNAPTAKYFDQSAKVLRIRQAPGLPVVAGDSTDISSAESPYATSQSQMSAASPSEALGTAPFSGSEKMTGKKLCQPEKKSKVGRPPNAFILYRKHHHPILLESRPDLPNCEISKVLGKQWHNESAAVHAEWVAKADKVKKQHALENPGYQYAPRKPSEKKRRMTARKLASLRASQAAGESQGSSDTEMMDVAGMNQAFSESRIAANRPHEVAMFYNDNQPISTNALLANERASTYPSRFKKNYETDDMSIVFPAGHDNVEHDYNIRASRYEPRDPSEHINLGSTTYSEVRSSLANSTLAADRFMNDLIDWDAIEGDAKLVHDAVDQSNLETIDFDSAEERAQFQQEMNRVLAMFD